MLPVSNNAFDILFVFKNGWDGYGAAEILSAQIESLMVGMRSGMRKVRRQK
jgi:hypothetical protein